MRLAVEAGLLVAPGEQKTLPPWLFYDDEGSRLFEDITLLPEYYLTRTERGLFVDHADDIVARARGDAARLHLIELGAGFAFVGRQVPLEVGGDDFFIDLLFYHLKLRCYVVVELKAGSFKPEHTGKLGFYLSAVDAQIKHPDDQPTIGLLLCKSKNTVVAEYALRDSNKPIGVAEYQLVQSLPANLQTNLPSIDEIEAEFAGTALPEDRSEGCAS